MKIANAWILAQIRDGAASGGGRRWVVALATLPFFGVLAAFGTAPSTITQPIVSEQVVESLSLPEVAAVPAGEPHFWREETIRRGDTLANVLARLHVSEASLHSYLRQSKDARPLLQLTPGRSIQALTTESGSLITLRYRTDSAKELLVTRDEEAYVAKSKTVDLEQQLIMKSATVSGSLFAAMDDSDVPDAIADQLLKIFSGDIDFRKDTRRGDRFSLVYEGYYLNGALVRSGRLLAAEFVSKGKSYRAVWFEGEPGKGAYYTPEGRTVRKTYLRSPIEYSRVSSGFSEARLHPILQYVRAHKGVDYVAPIGTKVLAASDGTVEFVGQQSGYGNVVIIEHRDNVSTLYAHLAGFGAGLQKGQRVEQGDVIGYVGMTGLTTGPHLHYEFRVNGEHQDPLDGSTAQSLPLTTELRAVFDERARPLADRLALLRGTNLARFE
ncbi:MAG: M23 family metallopeptidase [Burkholderiales bacterium]|jgi:murein DD-endopeptidase MepM/ murein hydrolase activator NlpD|nr:M23 family metallopeptidase [Burkholderiales bacterium]